MDRSFWKSKAPGELGARSPGEAYAAAERIGYPVYVRIVPGNVDDLEYLPGSRIANSGTLGKFIQYYRERRGFDEAYLSNPSYRVSEPY